MFETAIREVAAKIGVPEFTDETVGVNTPGAASTGSPTDAGNHDPAGVDGHPPSASAAPHPFAGLFEVAIDGIATITANFVRERLSRIIHTATSKADPEAQPTATSNAAPTISHHRTDGLLMVVAAAAITTIILWYFHEKNKASGS